MKRRDFLKITGLVGTGSLVLESCKHRGKSILPVLVQDEVPIPGAEEWVSSVCCQCPAGCGIIVRIVEGKAKKIEGNPSYPINQGKLCARGQAGLQVLYNPDRIQGPQKRAGARGDGQWSRTSWDEAIRVAAGKLKELRQRGEAHTFGFLTAKYNGHMNSLVDRFMMAFGSPNHISFELFSDEPLLKANLLNMGYETFVAHDLENVNYLLSFGTEYLETSRSPVRFNLAYGHMRQGRPGMRAKVVQVQSRFSLTAANADEWVPIQPGREGALALAIAHTIIDEGLYNQEFIETATSGFETFKNLILKEYSPKEVSVLIGVSEDKIKRLARDFARRRPSLALCGDSALAHTNGLTTALAVNSLNAIMGNFGQPGGIFFDPLPPFGALPQMRKDRTAQERLRMPRLDRADQPPSRASNSITKLVESLLTGQPYPLNALFIHEVNPVFSLPRSLRFSQALEKIPFIVSFSSFMDESTQMADLVLPDQTFLERWQDHVPSPGLGIPIAGIIKPVVKPLYDLRSTADVLILLARELGGDDVIVGPDDVSVD